MLFPVVRLVSVSLCFSLCLVGCVRLTATTANCVTPGYPIRTWCPNNRATDECMVIIGKLANSVQPLPEGLLRYIFAHKLAYISCH